MLKLLGKISAQVNRNTILLQAMQRQQTSTEGTDHMDPVEEFGLPLKTEVDFQNLEESLEDKAKRRGMVSI